MIHLRTIWKMIFMVFQMRLKIFIWMFFWFIISQESKIVIASIASHSLCWHWSSLSQTKQNIIRDQQRTNDNVSACENWGRVWINNKLDLLFKIYFQDIYFYKLDWCLWKDKSYNWELRCSSIIIVVTRIGRGSKRGNEIKQEKYLQNCYWDFIQFSQSF